VDETVMTGRVAIVAGGTGALGRSVSARLLAAGAAVSIPYAVDAELEALRAQVGAGARLHTVRTDVTDEASFDAFVKTVLQQHGRIDVLVNGVGGFAGGDLLSTPLAEWDRMMALNLTSAVIGCRAALPAMSAAGYGRIVNVSSRAVVPPMGGFIAYTVAKAAVIALTQALAREVARGVTVNAVLPSTMDTPANRAAMPDADRSGWVSTDAVAAVIAFLASADAGAISGAVIPV
jgi:NAD(P)-dependent dehydrogenase (short-subunit alcohol dehydrogenase family)